ncbi:MAG: hypothetical protein KBC20_01250 [Oscillospiraceae bacterium]|nr:hypothetical protein [Oscillospiraceae bacterium]
MAERRMFAKTIVLSDAFLDMPMTARCLYFSLGMVADDDGFVNNPKGVVRQIGASSEDINTLITNKFLIAFDRGPIVIKHWRINNYLRPDRYRETTYTAKKAALQIEENGSYKLNASDSGIPNSVFGIPQTENWCTQYRIGKDRIVEDICVPDGTKKGSMPPALDEVTAYIAEKNLHIDPVRFWNYYESNGWRVGKNPMKSWHAACATWNAKDGPKPITGKTASFDPAEVGKRARETDPVL